MPGVHLMWVNAPDIALTGKPGQFIMVRCGDECMMPLRRPLSLHEATLDKGGAIALLFAVVGKGTHWLSCLEEGTKLDIFGPLGRNFSFSSTSRKLLLVAGGMGIAPLKFLAQEALNQGYSVTLLMGVVTAAQLYPPDMLPPGVQLVNVTEDGTAGRRGLVTEILPDFLDGADQVFACGPMAMYRAIAAQTQGMGKSESIQLSLEMRMACGLGACYGCTVPTGQGVKQVCRDGPVFQLDDILWDELEDI